MSAYLDTSAMIRAWRMGAKPEGVTRAHAVSEFYCVLTGPGLAAVQGGKTVKLTLSPTDSSQAARETFENISFRNLTAAETLDSLDGAAQANVQGRGVHDWMHCEAALLANCHEIVTLNRDEFGRMTELKLLSPADYLASKYPSGQTPA